MGMLCLLLAPPVLSAAPQDATALEAGAWRDVEGGGPTIAPSPAGRPTWTGPFTRDPARPSRVAESPVAGTDGAVCLRVHFPTRVHLAADTPANVSSRYFASDPTPPAESLTSFFRKSSGGRFEIEGTVAPQWVRADQSVEYYGTFETRDPPVPTYGNAQTLAVEALGKSDPFVDFAQADRNGDGVVDHVYVIHAGVPDDADGDATGPDGDPDIWSISWYFAGLGLQFDNVYVKHFIIVSVRSPVATAVHETGHDFGLPDLYDEDYSSMGVGGWDLMGLGNTADPPVDFSAWSKERLGWVAPTIVTRRTARADLLSAAAAGGPGTVLKLWVRETAEYFLVENRQPTGLDARLPGGGLLIWHVDRDVADNRDETHRLLDLEEASATQDLDSWAPFRLGDAGDPWTNGTGPAGFSPISTPSSLGYNGTDRGVAILDVGPPGPAMVADVWLGFPAPVTRVVVTPAQPDGLDGWYRTRPVIELVPGEAAVSSWSWDEGTHGTLCASCANRTVPSIPEGIHRLSFASTDLLGNQEASREMIFKVDSRPPVTVLSTVPPAPDGSDGWFVTVPSITLAPNATDRNATWYRWDSDAPRRYDGPFTAPAGEHRLRFWSSDTAGGQEPEQELWFLVDTDVPAIALTVTPAAPDGLDGWYRSHPSVIALSDAPVTVSVDGEAARLVSGPVEVQDGVHLIRWTARDAAGNAVMVERAFRVDTLAPPATLTVLPDSPTGSSGWYVTRPSVRVLSDFETRVLVRWDEADWMPVAPGWTGAAPDGVHRFEAFATDAAGNKGPVSSLLLYVDTVPPVLAAELDPPVAAGAWSLESMQILLSTETGATIWWGWDGRNPSPGTGTVDVPAGKHRFTAYAIDQAGNRGPNVLLTTRVDLDDPVAVVRTPGTARVGEAVPLSAADSSDASRIVLYRWAFGDGSRFETDQARVVHRYDRPGRYTVTLTVVDAAGREGLRRGTLDIAADPLGVIPGGLPVHILLAVVVAAMTVGGTGIRRRRRRALTPGDR